ncbi:DNA/RNA non-specific endonuclease [Allorhodopirellula heiligendammensis]|uniref:Serine protease n=1 Tax=Allorhodopirellula heiligendammensis TaxID=2714739 RepID=A0A5C6BEM0_9BACT|nr:DNA/RNA non-specific endonuclease [Allorhodopirellula heiligendammensis]TWU09729.1 Nuclease precursor [Allorhodopirellula heiligendammensis]
MEKPLPPDELARRIAQTLKSLAGDTPVEEFVGFVGDDDSMEGVSSREIKKAQNAAASMQRGKTPSAEGMYHLEAIVHLKHRPSHRVTNNTFDAFPGDFRYMSTDRKVRKCIETSFPAIGRIDITDLHRYEGTGFVVGKNLVMTNRHVGQIFTQGVGRHRIRLQPWGTEIDFAEEPGFDEPDGYELIEPIMIHPYWDMALFRADLPDIQPLELSTTPYKTLLKRNQDIVAIGYPARDSRNGQRAQREIFGDEYEIKRIAPGRIAKRKREISSRWLSVPVDALAHDASTLGGNSGSAIINVDDGTVSALHFAGRYMLENYGVPGYELARDTRIIDSGVQFAGELPPKNNDLAPFWDDIESRPDPSDAPHDPNTSISVFTGNRSSSTQSHQMSHDDEITVEVPLRITISLGPAKLGAGSAGAPGPDADRHPGGVQNDPNGPDDDLIGEADYDIGESNGSGYDPDFLSEHVPVPRLPKKIANDTFELNGETLVDYTHFSVCQSKSRRLPRLVAWNIDGGDMKQLSRSGIRFILDRRIPQEYQAGNELYSRNAYDRGHVARRADLNWGPIREAKNANRDSFFFTNMTPQHEAFNQSSKGGLWGELENAIFADAKVDHLKISVMAGPIFKETDKKYRDVQIPDDFWKLIVFHDEEDDEFKVAAYIISQRDLVFSEGQVDDEFHLYQVSLTKLAEETGLDFDDIAEFDTHTEATETARGVGVREIKGRENLLG